MSKPIIHFAIASHKRLDILKTRTLAFLARHDIKKNITIFASPESCDEYRRAFADDDGITVVLSGASIRAARNDIIQHYEEDAFVVEIDDDVKDLVCTVKGEPQTSAKNLMDVLRDGFKHADLFGFNANTNPFYSFGEVRYGLRSIVNSFIGYRNDKTIVLKIEEKEDFERTLQFYAKTKRIRKDGRFGVKTKYWTNPGGIQARYDAETRKRVQRESADAIMNMPMGNGKFGRDCCWILKRKNGIWDIRFRSRDPLKLYDDPTINSRKQRRKTSSSSSDASNDTDTRDRKRSKRAVEYEIPKERGS